MIRKRWCPECEGLGHPADCMCGNSPVEFIMGCCRRCGGEGLIPDKDPEPTGLVDKHGNPLLPVPPLDKTPESKPEDES